MTGYDSLFRNQIGIAATTLLLFGCSGAEDLEQDAGPSGSFIHVTPWRSPNDPAPDAAGATPPHLKYYGGPILQNVKVATVFWGPKVNGDIQKGMPGFYQNIINSPYIDWLSEYNTPSPAQSIGRGSSAGIFTITPSTTAASIQDSDIQKELNGQIAAGNLPAPDSNTLYMVHFPPGMSIGTANNGSSCVSGGFCGYHGTFSRASKNVYYGVLPDLGPGSGCDVGCGSVSAQLDRQTGVSSHELAESITDAGVGLAATLGPPLGWYDFTDNAEIADLCVGQLSPITVNKTTYQVQKLWSNQSNACITTRVSTGDFSIALKPAQRIMGQSTSVTYLVQTTPVSGTPKVALSVSGLPQGVIGAFNATSVTAGQGATLTLTTNTSGVGLVSFTVTGVAGNVSHQATAEVDVIPANVNLLGNGGFEQGGANWTASGAISFPTGMAHSGTASALVGKNGNTLGEGHLSQYLIVPDTGSTTLSFAFKPTCAGTLSTERLEVLLADPSGAVFLTLMSACTTNANWLLQSVNLTPFAGKTLQLMFQVRHLTSKISAATLQVDDVGYSNH